jgi:Malectin domain
LLSLGFSFSTGDEYLENSGVRTWKADQYYTDGFTYSNSFQDISGTLDDAIYQGERWGEFSYEIPVPTGQYEITIHLVEM